MRVIVIGGTGAFASRVTQDCLDAGDEVLVVTRGQRTGSLTAQQPGLTWLHADRNQLTDHREQLEAFAPDAVVDAICFNPDHARQLVDLFPDVPRVVMISTVDVYGEEVGADLVTEDWQPNPMTPYAVGKAHAERVVLAGLGGNATIIRPSHMLGRGFLTNGLWGRTEHVVARLRAGLPVAVLDGGRGVITPVYAGDVATWVRASFALPRADGEVFNAVGGWRVTMRDYVQAIADHLGVPTSITSVPSPIVREALAMPTQFAFHRPYSSAKATTLLGHRPAGTLPSMIAETVAAMPVLDLGSPDGLPAALLAANAAENALHELVARQEAELAEVLKATDPRIG